MSAHSPELLREYLALLEYEEALRGAEEDLIAFSQAVMPDPRRYDDIHASKYLPGRHHRFMADVMMSVERGERKKVIVNTAPRHGKTQLCTKNFCAWYSARHPEDDIIVATYGDTFAKDFAKEVREIIASERFKQIFPDYHLVAQTDEKLTTYMGGTIFFLGRRSPTTGRGADLILVDDPTKDDKEVRYQTFREDCWQWFTQTLLTRRHTDKAALVVSQTRWHEDDIVGRISDKNNPAYSPKLAEGFEIINIPAIAMDDDPLGRKPGEALWPERFGINYLEEMQEANSASFAALYQCDPTPDDGVFFRADDIFEYEELPQNLRVFCASDHAVATKQINDPTVLVPFGIDEAGDAYILPQIIWQRLDSERTVEEMLAMMQRHHPIFWYAEKGHISKSIGPFLRKRMEETGTYCPVVEVQPVGDKIQRAQSGRARCAQGKIRFPKFAPWWPRAKSELLKFPNGRFDDFVDVVSMIGLQVGASTAPRSSRRENAPQPGTFGYMLQQFREMDSAERAKRARSGW